MGLKPDFMNNIETSGKVRVLKKVPNRIRVDHEIKQDFMTKHNSYFDPATKTIRNF